MTDELDDNAVFDFLYGGDTRLDKSVMDKLMKRWDTPKVVHVSVNDLSELQNLLGFKSIEWFIQQGLIMAENLEDDTGCFHFKTTKSDVKGYVVNGRLYDSLKLFAKKINRELEDVSASVLGFYLMECVRNLSLKRGVK